MIHRPKWQRWLAVLVVLAVFGVVLYALTENRSQDSRQASEQLERVLDEELDDALGRP